MDYNHFANFAITCTLLILLFPKVGSLASELSDNHVRNEESADEIAQRCSDCRVTSRSIYDLVKRPREMNLYGEVEDRIDLQKIKKAICKDIASDLDRERCRNFFFNHLDQIEEWKRHTANTQVSFHDFICIQKMKYCCGTNSFGPRCARCPTCGENERCSGEGTRSGNGTCICKEGHIGPKCARCEPGFHAIDRAGVWTEQNQNLSSSTRRNAFTLRCIPCHKSCLTCRHEGPLGCEVCQKGFNWLAPYGCVDIDECIESKQTICGSNTFCVNTVGSYFCYECDRGCDGCNGDGPDMCLKCAKNYRLENGICVALKKTILPPEANYYRYAIYIGLCICTCILFQNNVYIASFIGLAVALYIGFSEYIMSQHLFTSEESVGMTGFSL